MEALTNTNFADQAEKVINSLVKEDNYGNRKIDLTTSKIRNLLTMTNVVYNQARQIRGNTLDEDLLRDIQYLKMRIAYEAGREPRTVKPFVEKAKLMEHIDGIGNRKDALLLFCKYFESLVAYHRFYGGKDR